MSESERKTGIKSKTVHILSFISVNGMTQCVYVFLFISFDIGVSVPLNAFASYVILGGNEIDIYCYINCY